VKVLKAILIRYKAWIMAVLAPLGGIWAVGLVSLIDAAFLGIPVDPVVAYYVVSDPRRCVLYAVMASLGSTIGGTVPYLIGYYGGETLVEKRLGPRRFARMHALSEKYGDLALIIPALMPPGFPFKAFQLMAGVTEMRYVHFLLSVFLGRLLRFLLLGTLIIAYGPEIFDFLAMAYQHHRGAFFAGLAVLIALIVALLRFSKSRRRRAKTETTTLA
jgi:membrane protein YqaA with SNARE-associated domain